MDSIPLHQHFWFADAPTWGLRQKNLPPTEGTALTFDGYGSAGSNDEHHVKTATRQRCVSLLRSARKTVMRAVCESVEVGKEGGRKTAEDLA